MINNRFLKNILYALAVAFFGFILLNLTFILDWGFQLLINLIFKETDIQRFPLIRHFAFFVLILILSWFILNSRLKVIYKAVFLTVPTAVVFVTLGILLYRWTAILYTAGIIIYACIALFLYLAKKPWLYYYSVTLVALTLLIMGILGIEI